MASPFLDSQGNFFPQDQVIGNGNTAVVLLQDGVALKVPLRYPWNSDSDVKVNIESIQHEQNIYRRLHNPGDHRSRGIVRYIKFSDDSTQLAYMANGDLRSFLQTSRPSCQLQLKWFIEMAWTLDYIHERCVLVTDIASRNFLIDYDFSLKICDFSEGSLLPLGSEMELVDDNGYSTRIDIGLLGAVMYEIVTGNKCAIDLYKNNSPTDGRAYWPERSDLPDTKSIEFGWIIENCWNGQFRSAHSIAQALLSINSSFSPPIIHMSPVRSLASIKDSITEIPIKAVIGILGLAMCALVVAKKQF